MKRPSRLAAFLTGKDSWRVAAVLAAAVLPYLEAPSFSFVAHDDAEHVDGHPVVSNGLTLAGVIWAFGIGAQPQRDGWLNWPLTWLSHMLDVSMFGNWAGGHHLVNVALHAINSFLVLRLTTLIGLGPASGVFVSCLFAVHPVQVESVAWVSERKTVLSAGLMFLTMIVYLRDSSEIAVRQRLSVWVAWNVIGAMALLAKPLAVTLPCVLLLFDVVLQKRIHGSNLRSWLVSWMRCIAPKSLLFFLAIADCVWTVSAQREYGAVAAIPLSTRVPHALVVYATYLRVFFLPYDLGCHHPHTGMPTMIEVIGAICAIGLCTGFAIAAYLRTKPAVLFGWLWFLGTLVPMVGLVQVGGNAWSDRYMYVPIVGLAIALVEGIAFLRCLGVDKSIAREFDNSHDWAFKVNSRFMRLAGCTWLAVLGLAAWHQAGTWRNTGTLARAWIMSHPGFSDAWNILAVYHASLGEYGKAEHALRMTITLDDQHESERLPDRIFNLGRLLLQTGRSAEAAEEFAAALACDPEHAAAMNGLGVALTRLEEFDRAVEVFQRRLKRDSRDVTAWVGLGNARFLAGSPELAVECFTQALAIDPADVATRENLARARSAVSAHPTSRR